METQPEKLTWREKCLCRILFIIARIIGTRNPEVGKELTALENHISVGERFD